MHELVDAGVAPIGLAVAGSSDQEHVGHPIDPEFPCDVDGLGGTAVVGATDHGDRATRFHGGADTGDSQQVRGERGALRVLGQRAKRYEADDGVGGLAGVA